jgi:hypothetical protein
MPLGFLSFTLELSMDKILQKLSMLSAGDMDYDLPALIFAIQIFW